MNVKTAHDLLLDAAHNQTTVSYKAIIDAAEITLIGDALSGALGHLFYEIVHTELAADPSAPMLSAVAIPLYENMPSMGFFVLAHDLGRFNGTTEMDRLTFWSQELAACYRYWA